MEVFVTFVVRLLTNVAGEYNLKFHKCRLAPVGPKQLPYGARQVSPGPGEWVPGPGGVPGAGGVPGPGEVPGPGGLVSHACWDTTPLWIE